MLVFETVIYNEQTPCFQKLLPVRYSQKGRKSCLRRFLIKDR